MHAAQYQKHNKLIKNRGGRSKQTFSKDDIHMAHEKMLSITNYKRNANQNYNEEPLHTI